MSETKIGMFIQRELMGCRDEFDWLMRCYRCAVNDCPEECCPPIPLPVLPAYIINLIKRAGMTENGILPPTLEIIYQTYYPLPVKQ